MNQQEKTTIVDIAIREGIDYHEARKRAFRGEFGKVVREGRLLYVLVPDSEPTDEKAGQ